MPSKAARFTVKLFGLLALVCFLSAIWLPEHVWRFVGSGVIFLIVAIFIMAFTDPSLGKK